MSDHAWILENLESYSAGGLEPDERDRLEQHVRSCSPCARALEKARSLDRTMESLFTPVRPEAALEDRLIWVLRSRSRRWIRRQIIAAAAAVILLAALGAGLSKFIERGELEFPWAISSRLRAQNHIKQLVMDVDTVNVRGGSGEPWFNPAASRGVARLDAAGDGLLDAEQLAVQSREEATGSLVHDDSGSMSRKEPTISPKNEHWLEPYKRQDSFVERRTDRDARGVADGSMKPVEESDLKESLGDKPVQSPRAHSWGASSYAANAIVQGKAFSPDGKQGAAEIGSQLSLGRQPRISSVVKGTSRVHEGRADGVMPAQASSTAAEAEFSYRSALPTSGAVNSYFKPGDQGRSDTKGESKATGEAFTPFGLLGASKGQEGKDRNQAQPSASEQKPAEPAKPPAERVKELINNSEDLRQVQHDWERAWINDESSHLTPERVHGGISVDSNGGKSANPQGTGKEKPGAGGQEKPPSPPSALPRKIVIRSGEIEFEIESFDAAVAAVTKLVNQYQGGYVDTVNSDKLPNGKVKGSVVVRVPPQHLDSLILDLRKELGKGGELKTLHVGSEDITKQYTDLESRLRAARTMEERLLQIIKTGKGEIKDLLNAEKELGVWRTRVEELQGELNYYANRVSLSTLTISLYEKEIRAPAALVEIERVQMGIEVEDVDKAQQQVLKEVAASKGRVTKSELRQQAAGQFNAVMSFEVPPDAAGPLRDHLRQLGTVARLEVDRLQQSEDGSGRPQTVIKSRRNDTQFFLSLYNVANVAPRETIHLSIASADVESAYRAVVTRVQKSSGRVVASNLNRQKNEQTSGTIQFEVKSAEADALLRELKDTGEVLRVQFTENPDTANVTRSKRGFDVQLLAFGLVLPRETARLEAATKDVPDAYRRLQEAIATIKVRVLTAQLNEQDREDLKAQLEFDLRRADQPAIDAVLEKIGDVYARTVTRAADADNILESRLRMQIALVNAARIPPRETVKLAVEVSNVDQTAGSFSAQVKESGGRVAGSNVSHESNGRVTALLTYDVPLARADDLLRKFTSAGVVRVLQSSHDPKVPDSPLAIARLTVTLSNAELIVPSDDGLWPQIRKGLSTSFIALSWSLTVVIVGVCFVLPWVVVAYFAYRLVARLRRGAATGNVTP
jgi:anti-sigma factor RsiW